MENDFIKNNDIKDNFEENESDSLTIDNNKYEDYSDKFQMEENQKSGKISKDNESKQIKSQVNFHNVKSNFILKKIFAFMINIKALNIIKYNKKLQKRLNFTIYDYKNFSSIEIELKLVDNKFGNFINISDEEKENFKIYFDNSNEEIKKNYLEENKSVKTIKILINYQTKSFSQLFDNCMYINSIIFKNFHRTDITNMYSMFNGCSSLKELNLSNFNTDNVTNMNGMFSGCSALKELNLSNFNTDNVVDMSCMFQECRSLKELNLSNFKTNNVHNMSYMFYKCISLK